jgi:hypothetical protein
MDQRRVDVFLYAPFMDVEHNGTTVAALCFNLPEPPSRGGEAIGLPRHAEREDGLRTVDHTGPKYGGRKVCVVR